MTARAGRDLRPLQHVLASLARIKVIPRVTKILDPGIEGTNRALRDAVLAEIPAFTMSGNPFILLDLERHTSEHVDEIRRLFGGGEVGDFAFVETHARRRAEQRFPLEVTLHAYRCGHRVLSRWLRDAAIAVKPAKAETAVDAIADFAIEYTNAISAIATSEYVAHTRALAAAEVDRRAELLNILLNGYDESDERVGRLLKRAGFLEQRQSYCVAVVQAVNAAEMEHRARAQRLWEAVVDAMAKTSIRVLAGVRNNLVVAVLMDARRQSGWTAPCTGLAKRIRPQLQKLGPSVLVGISLDHPSTAFLPKALQEAMTALDFAGVDRRVVEFSTIPFRALLLHRGGDQVRLAPPVWSEPLAAADRKIDGALVQTLRAVADADMNVQQAARNLHRHPNTIYARLERIKSLTGLDGQRYHDLTELLLIVDCRRG
jgi:PucR C-terminal helix-turn-helix domain/GGDEF-like domain